MTEDAGWEATNHGHLPKPTRAQFDEMHDDVTARNLYAAQRAVFFPNVPRTPEGVRQIPYEFDTTAQMDKFALDIQKSAFAAKNWPKFAKGKPVKYFEGHEGTPFDEMLGLLNEDDPTYLSYGASASTNNESLTIAIAPEGFGHSKSTVLHELAHIINDYEGIMRDHGPDFLGIYAKLVREYMPEKYARFMRVMRQYGLQWAQ